MFKRKCLNLVLIVLLQVLCASRTGKSKRKHCIILASSIIIIVFVFNHIPESRRELTFADILHNLPVEEKRNFVWKTALEILNNNHSNVYGYPTKSFHNETIVNMISNLISNYKVRVIIKIQYTQLILYSVA